LKNRLKISIKRQDSGKLITDKFNLIVAPMNDSFVNIQEKRLALAELDSIMKHVRNEYGNNPPVGILTALVELAKAYRLKYGSTNGKQNDNPEIQNFFVKNGLPLL